MAAILSFTIQNPTPKMSGFRMIPYFEWSDFGSPLYFNFLISLLALLAYGLGLANWRARKCKAGDKKIEKQP